jgi:hypothetical protein
MARSRRPKEGLDAVKAACISPDILRGLKELKDSASGA